MNKPSPFNPTRFTRPERTGTCNTQALVAAPAVVVAEVAAIQLGYLVNPNQSAAEKMYATDPESQKIKDLRMPEID
ncbi:hypothetical protein [Chitinimonas taiwanensis]|uniref:hypothetical protein n=1 Tax=Chitinimonas taiwanensis TaxID=240412 RepID=UPI0035AF7487